MIVISDIKKTKQEGRIGMTLREGFAILNRMVLKVTLKKWPEEGEVPALWISRERMFQAEQRP